MHFLWYFLFTWVLRCNLIISWGVSILMSVLSTDAKVSVWFFLVHVAMTSESAGLDSNPDFIILAGLSFDICKMRKINNTWLIELFWEWNASCKSLAGSHKQWKPLVLLSCCYHFPCLLRGSFHLSFRWDSPSGKGRLGRVGRKGACTIVLSHKWFIIDEVEKRKWNTLSSHSYATQGPPILSLSTAEIILSCFAHSNSGAQFGRWVHLG